MKSSATLPVNEPGVASCAGPAPTAAATTSAMSDRRITTACPRGNWRVSSGASKLVCSVSCPSVVSRTLVADRRERCSLYSVVVQRRLRLGRATEEEEKPSDLEGFFASG